MELERIALNDKYFIERKLYPNVDFYSGIIYKAMGFPTDLFPVLFMIPRVVGWLAHWSEFLDDPEKTQIITNSFIFSSNLSSVSSTVLIIKPILLSASSLEIQL